MQKNLVKQILTFSRKGPGKKINLQLSSLVKETFKLIKPSLPSSIEVKQEIGTSEAEIFADPSEIHEMLIHLCNNAADAMKDKGGILNINLSGVERDFRPGLNSPAKTSSECIKLSVSDIGHGMENHVIERIFEPYFTTKDDGGASGMGLTMVHEIVTGCGGEITVDSSPGEGTTVEIYLPLVPGEDDQVSADDTHLKGGDERILFVDDEQAVIRAVKPCLERLGYHVLGSNSSTDAMELLSDESSRFDMVITDYTMPGINGLLFAGKLKAMHPDIPVILCTGHGENVNENKAEMIGVAEILFKPVIVKEMAESIRRVFDHDINRGSADG